MRQIVVPINDIEFKKPKSINQQLADIVHKTRAVPVTILVKKIKPRFAIQFGKYKGQLGYLIVDTQSVEGRTISAKWYSTKQKALKKMPPDCPFEALTDEGCQWIAIAKKEKLRRVECTLIEIR